MVSWVVQSFFSFTKVQYPNLMERRLSKYPHYLQGPFSTPRQIVGCIWDIPTYFWGQGDRVHSTKISLNSLAGNVGGVDFWVVFCVVFFLCFSLKTVHSVPSRHVYMPPLKRLLLNRRKTFLNCNFSYLNNISNFFVSTAQLWSHPYIISMIFQCNVHTPEAEFLNVQFR